MKFKLSILISFCLGALGSLQAMQRDELRTFMNDLERNVGLVYNEDPRLPTCTTEDTLQMAREKLIAMQQLQAQYKNTHRYFESYMNSLIVGQNAVINWIILSLAENENSSDSEQ